MKLQSMHAANTWRAECATLTSLERLPSISIGDIEVRDQTDSLRRPSGRESWRHALADRLGQNVVGYAFVAAVFVVVLILVISALGDSIGVTLQDLIGQLPFGT